MWALNLESEEPTVHYCLCWCKWHRQNAFKLYSCSWYNLCKDLALIHIDIRSSATNLCIAKWFQIRIWVILLLVNSVDPMLLGWLMRFFYAIWTKADFKLQVFCFRKKIKTKNSIQLLENAFDWLKLKRNILKLKWTVTRTRYTQNKKVLCVLNGM